MKPYIMPVNPFENHKDAKSSVIGIKETLRHLSDGKPLGMFPAGEVSTYKDGKLVVDKDWEEGAIKVIQKSTSSCSSHLFSCQEQSFFLSFVENKSNAKNGEITIRTFNSKR
jgi:putative hemolysin